MKVFTNKMKSHTKALYSKQTNGIILNIVYMKNIKPFAIFFIVSIIFIYQTWSYGHKNVCKYTYYLAMIFLLYNSKFSDFI